MKIETVTINNKTIAVISDENLILTDVQSALDLIGTIGFEYRVNRVVIDKNNITEDFFTLRNQLAGDILQKFSTYQVKIAIVGDFSMYTSEALLAFIRESNQGSDVFFLTSKDEALRKLSEI